MIFDGFLNRLNDSGKPLILDGAIGSLLQQRGFKSDSSLWTSYINFRKPEVIRSIHLEYINAGAEIITSNTFRTNPVSLNKANIDLDLDEAVKLSMQISRSIADKYKVILAGSNAPAEDCYQKERTLSPQLLIDNHEKHIDLLYKYGADIILNETQSHYEEIMIICKYCSENEIPFIISLFVTDELELLSGEKLKDIIYEINDYNPLAIMFNCITESVLNKIINEIELIFRWGFYINCGSGNFVDETIFCGIDENRYAEIVKSCLNLNPRIIGACCGSNPNHIKQINNLFDE